MINIHSDYLVILVASFNRSDLLKKTLDSIDSGTACSHETIVIDGGSTDGTIELLKSYPQITPVLQNTLLGPARAYNQVARQVESKFVCWLSDDTEIAAGSLDLAVSTLEQNNSIGMVGLKMKDIGGDQPYKGGVSLYGILNCNHGVYSNSLFQSLGFFNEDYPFYGFDPDFTTSVLCAGKQVVMTKQISVHHHRHQWAKTKSTDKKVITNRHTDWTDIYRQKFNFLDASLDSEFLRRVNRWNKIEKFLTYFPFKGVKISGRNLRDWRNHFLCRFISRTDYEENRNNAYHLVQQIPQKFLKTDQNPYQNLVGNV